MAYVASTSLTGSARSAGVSVFGLVGSAAHGAASLVNSLTDGVEIIDLHVKNALAKTKVDTRLDLDTYRSAALDNAVNAEVDRQEATWNRNFPNKTFDRAACFEATNDRLSAALVGL